MLSSCLVVKSYSLIRRHFHNEIKVSFKSGNYHNQIMLFVKSKFSLFLFFVFVELFWSLRT